MAKRITVRIPDDVCEKVYLWSGRCGVTVSQLGGMAVQAGIDSIIRAISPVESLTPDQWAAIIRAMESQGVRTAGAVDTVDNVGVVESGKGKE